MKVSVGVSNHHVHLSHEDYKILFGNREMLIRNKLKQPGQFASKLVVDVKGRKGKLKGIRVLGPNRDYTQVEITRSDSYKLGINPPVRDSGNLEGAAFLTIIGPKGQIKRKCGIIANRHIHIDEKIRKQKKLEEVSVVSLKIKGEKGGIIENVYLKDSKSAYFEVHLDTDDANAFLLKNNDEVEII